MKPERFGVVAADSLHGLSCPGEFARAQVDLVSLFQTVGFDLYWQQLLENLDVRLQVPGHCASPKHASFLNIPRCPRCGTDCKWKQDLVGKVFANGTV